MYTIPETNIVQMWHMKYSVSFLWQLEDVHLREVVFVLVCLLAFWFFLNCFFTYTTDVLLPFHYNHSNMWPNPFSVLVPLCHFSVLIMCSFWFVQYDISCSNALHYVIYVQQGFHCTVLQQFNYITLYFNESVSHFGVEFISFHLYFHLSSFPMPLMGLSKDLLPGHSCKLQDAAVTFWTIIFQTVAVLQLQQTPYPGSLLNIMSNCGRLKWRY